MLVVFGPHDAAIVAPLGAAVVRRHGGGCHRKRASGTVLTIITMDSEGPKAALRKRTSPRLSGMNPGKPILSKGRPANDCSSTPRPRKRAKFTGKNFSDSAKKNKKEEPNIRKKHVKKTNKDEEGVTKRIEGYRCSPHMIPPIIARLSELQKNWVIKIGFGSLLTIPDCRLPKCLTMWLINQVNCDTQCLEVGGKSVPIKPLVYNLLGIPRGKIIVPPPYSGRKNNRCSKADSIAQQFKAATAGRGLPANIAIEELVNMHDEETFCRSFMLIVLCIYLAPTSGHVINRNYLPTLSNVSLIPDMNWCDYSADYLIQGIRDYKQAQVHNVNVHGCVHILDLMYIDLVKSPLLKVPQGTPRINFITSHLLLQLDSMDIKSTCRKEITYGRLEVTSAVPGKSNTDNNCTPEVSDNDSTSELEVDADKEKEQPEYSDSTQKGNTLSEQLQRIEHKYNSKRDSIVAWYNERMKKKMENLDARKLEEISLVINTFQSSQKNSRPDNDLEPRSANVESQQIPSFNCESKNNDHMVDADNELERRSPNSMDVVHIASVAAAEALLVTSTQREGHSNCAEKTIPTPDKHLSSPNKVIAVTNNQSFEAEQISLDLTLFVPQERIIEPNHNSAMTICEANNLQTCTFVNPGAEITSTVLSDEIDGTTIIPPLCVVHSLPDVKCSKGETNKDTHSDSAESTQNSDHKPDEHDHSDSEMCTPKAIIPPDCETQDDVHNEVHRLIESFTPTIRLEETDVIEICDSASAWRPVDIKDITPLKEPIQSGRSFIDPGSVTTATKIRPKRYGKNDEIADGYAELVKLGGKHDCLAAVTYNEHVQMSKYRKTRRTKNSDQTIENKTKIRICGAFVTEEEFVHSLMPRGEVDLNFMWVCCVAIMQDWGSRTKVILNQAMIRELMRPYKECDQQQLIRRLKKFRLNEIEQIYLPVCSNQHWILIVVNIVAASIEIYDSLRSIKKGEHPYKDLWDNMGSNLQQTYNRARNEFFGIHDCFDIHYPKTHTQTNSHDCGFSVIRLLQCHNGKDLIGYGKMKMSSYRKELAHTLVYHRLNDLNPDRPKGT